MPFYTMLLIGFTVSAAVVSQLIFKQWVSAIGSLSFSISGVIDIFAKILKSPLMIGGLILYALGFLAWIFLLSRTSLSLVYPVILSANIILVLSLSHFFFNETLGMTQMIGVATILIGIFLVFTA